MVIGDTEGIVSDKPRIPMKLSTFLTAVIFLVVAGVSGYVGFWTKGYFVKSNNETLEQQVKDKNIKIGELEGKILNLKENHPVACSEESTPSPKPTVLPTLTVPAVTKLVATPKQSTQLKVDTSKPKPSEVKAKEEGKDEVLGKKRKKPKKEKEEVKLHHVVSPEGMQDVLSSSEKYLACRWRSNGTLRLSKNPTLVLKDGTVMAVSVFDPSNPDAPVFKLKETEKSCDQWKSRMEKEFGKLD